MEWKFYPVKKELEVTHFITAINSFRDKDFFFEGEMHDFWEIVEVTSGTATVSGDSRIYEMKPGSVVFHKPLEFHKIWANGKKAPHVRIISFRAKGDYMKRFKNVYMEFSQEQSFEFSEIVQEISDYLSNPDENATVPQDIATRFESFLLGLYPKKTHVEAKKTRNRRFQQILSVMHEHCNENLTLSELSELCSMSPSNLKKTFNSFYPHGIMNYFRMLKMREAAKLLKRGYSVHEVSTMLSFATQNYFSASFKREFGLSPSEYIKENKN